MSVTKWTGVRDMTMKSSLLAALSISVSLTLPVYLYLTVSACMPCFCSCTPIILVENANPSASSRNIINPPALDRNSLPFKLTNVVSPTTQIFAY
eukprot:746140-Hanusia_phi.AAC.3